MTVSPTLLAQIVPVPTSVVAGPLELLPRPDLDPFERLAIAFLAEYTANSARAYASDLRAWASWTLTVAQVHPLEARRHHVATWVRQLTQEPAARTGKPLAAASVSRRLACLFKFYGYGLEVGVITHSPVPHARRPTVFDDSTSVGLTRDELGRVLDAAAAHSLRSSALVHLLAFNGLRIAEALNADIDDLVHDRGHRALRVTRKGGKVGRVAIAPVTSRALDTYIAERTSGPIFLSRDGHSRLSYSSAYEQVCRLAKTADIAGAANIHPHSFRHTFATEALDAGAPCRTFKTHSATPTPAPPDATTGHATASTRTRPTPWPPPWVGCSPTGLAPAVGRDLA